MAESGDAQPESDEQPEDQQPNAADEKAVSEQKRRQRRSKDEAGDFWRRVFADSVGRREMWRLLEEAHTFETRFACGPNGFPNEAATWRALGEQDFGMRLYHSWLLMSPQGVLLAQQENDIRFRKPKRKPGDGE